MFLLPPFKGLAVAILFAAASVKALPFNSDGGFDSLFLDSNDLGQTTTDVEPPINIGSTDSFFVSSFPSVGENSNLLAQNFEQPIDLGTSSSSFPSIDENPNILAQNFEQPIDFGSLSSTFLPTVDENSNLLALGQNSQPITLGETFTLPDSGNGLLTTSEPDSGLLASGMSCPAGGSFFCCPDKDDNDCIPSKSLVCFNDFHPRCYSTWSYGFWYLSIEQDHPFCYDLARIFCCFNVDPNASNGDLNVSCHRPLQAPLKTRDESILQPVKTDPNVSFRGKAEVAINQLGNKRGQPRASRPLSVRFQLRICLWLLSTWMISSHQFLLSPLFSHSFIFFFFFFFLDRAPVCSFLWLLSTWMFI